MYRESRMGGGSRIYNPKQHILHDDGLLTIKVTGYEDDETHWTGWMAVSPAEPDYDFWYWLALMKPPGGIGERDLGKWKKEYAVSRRDVVEAVG